MKYNIENIHFSYLLISTFLVEIDTDILDISYTNHDKEISFQIVLLEGKVLSARMKDRIVKFLSEYNVTIKELKLSKEEFNVSRGEWLPKNYNWLENVLFSKAEIL